MPFNDIMHDGDLRYRVEKLEKKQREDNSGRRLENSSIGAGGLRLIDGGALTIDGGELKLIGDNGVELARWGRMASNGEISRGVRVNYHGGGPAQTIQGAPESQFHAVWDLDGNVVMSTDGASGVGIGRPWLPYRMVPSFNAEGVGEGATSLWPSTTSTSAVKLMQGNNPIQHPRVSIGVATATTGGGNVAWRLEINGMTAAEGAGAGSQTVDVPGWGSSIRFGQPYGFDLYAWCTGGATRGWVQVDRLYGRQSLSECDTTPLP